MVNDQSIGICERLVNQEGRTELANLLARAYSNKALALWELGDNRRALALYDQAIAIRQRLIDTDASSEFANNLAITYMNKAGPVLALGDHRGRCIALRPGDCDL